MTKGTKTVLFVLGASVVNILLTCVLFIVCLGLYSLTLAKLLPATAVMWAVMASFVVSLVGTFFIYKRLLAAAEKKYHIEEKLGVSAKRRLRD